MTATTELTRVNERIEELQAEAERVGLSTDGKVMLSGYEKHRTALQSEQRRQSADLARERQADVEAAVAKLQETFGLLQGFTAARKELDNLRAKAAASDRLAAQAGAASGPSLKALEAEFFQSREWRELRDQVMRYSNTQIL